ERAHDDAELARPRLRHLPFGSVDRDDALARLVRAEHLDLEPRVSVARRERLARAAQNLLGDDRARREVLRKMHVIALRPGRRVERLITARDAKREDELLHPTMKFRILPGT